MIFYEKAKVSLYKLESSKGISNLKNACLQRKWVFATNSNVQVPISSQPDSVILWYFKLRFFDNYQFEISPTLGCKDIKIRKSEFVAKSQFLYHLFQFNIAF